MFEEVSKAVCRQLEKLKIEEDEDDRDALTTSIAAETETLFSGFGFLFDLDNPDD